MRYSVSLVPGDYTDSFFFCGGGTKQLFVSEARGQTILKGPKGGDWRVIRDKIKRTKKMSVNQ